MRFSILICTLNERMDQFERIYTKLITQSQGKSVEILYERDNRESSVGAKRNRLIDKSLGEYTAFVDDDDDVSADYVDKILAATERDPDCIGLKGLITQDHLNPHQFIHSIRYSKWEERGGIYYRPPNHLNPIKRKITTRYEFREVNSGEDKDWCERMCADKVIQSEEFIETILYYYKYSQSGSATTGR